MSRTSLLRSGVSALALSAFAVFSLSDPATATDFTVPSATGSQTLTGDDTGTVNAGYSLSVSGVAVTVQGPTTGVTLDNYGTITSTGDRAIFTDGTTPLNFTINNAFGATISGKKDAIRIDAAVGDGTVIVNNGGIITSTTGEAIDFEKASVTTGTVTLNNISTGEISAVNSDAVRLGEGNTLNNYGSIYAGGTVGSGSKNDGVDLQGNTATINNMASGVISGFRHGITTDVDVTVTNYGTITGRNGSGVGSDGDGTVTNYGTITGAYAGVGNGDGDGVDIDYTGTINNYGTIQGTGAGGVDSGGDTNHSEGIAMGAGTINNYAGATISGADRGILIDDGSGGSAPGSVTIKNAGTIKGLANSAIKIVGANANTITNSGLITGAGSNPVIETDEGADTLTNSGVINGSIDLGGGVNVLDNEAGGVLNVNSVLSVGAGNTVNNAGTISPGGTGTVTTTTLTGSLAQSSTGTLAIDLDAAANTADRIDVTETATLDGNIKLSVAGLAISTGTVTVLTGGNSVDHTGLGLIASPALQAFLVYPDANTIQVSYDLSFAPTNIGLNGNQSSIGNHLNASVTADPNSLSGITGALLALTTAGQYTAALNQLSPEIYGDSAVATLYGAHSFGNALLSCRARDAQYVAVSEDQCLWLAISGRTLDQNTTASSIGYEEQTWAVSGGGQVNVAPSYVVGLAFGFEEGDGENASGARTDLSRAYAGVVLKHTVGPWYVAGAVFGGTGSADTTRPIDFGGLTTTATGDQTVSHLSGRLRVAYQFGGNALYVKPMVDLEATQLWLGSVDEQGGVGALSVASKQETIFSAAPAIEIGSATTLAGGTVLRPFARLGGVFYSDDNIALSSAFIGAATGTPNFSTSARIDNAMGNVGAGLDLVWRDGTTIKAQYDGLFGEDTQQHSFGAKASVKF